MLQLNGILLPQVLLLGGIFLADIAVWVIADVAAAAAV